LFNIKLKGNLEDEAQLIKDKELPARAN